MAHIARRVVRLSGLALIACVVAAGSTVAGAALTIVRRAARELPAPVALSSDRLVQDVVVVDRNGRRIAALRRGEHHREAIAYEAMSPFLRDAVVASEDERFWTHHGVDPLGIARAFLSNVRNGGHLQGGSTITQQLLKLTMLQGRPPLLRKVEEAMLAARFERLLTKEQLLRLYLNAVYLGGGNAGVESASRDLFGISASELTRGQAALLVGMIAAPSHRSPFCAVADARRHQRRVLRRMVAAHALTSVEADRSASAPIRFRLADDGPSEMDIASATDLVTASASDATRIATTFDLTLQQRAVRALRTTLEAYARSRGEHRGPRLVLRAEQRERWVADLQEFRETLREWGTGVREPLVYDLRSLPQGGMPATPCRYGSAIFRHAVPMGHASGIVTAVDPEAATLDLGDLRGTLSAASVAWAQQPLTTIAPVGAVVDVRLPDQLPVGRDAPVAVELIPRPIVEGAVVAIHPRTRELLALVGGTEPRRGGYNRALQASRPIGSTVKPFVFAAAIGSGVLEPDGAVHDVGYRYVNPETGAEWQPENWYDGHEGVMSVEDAIARSVNMAAVEATLATGVDRVAAVIEAASPVVPVAPVPAIALGALNRTPLELANAFATFADHGRVAPVRFLYSISPPLLEGEREGVHPGQAVLNPALTQTINTLLRQPITHPRGTARRLAKLQLDIRGKTGTTDSARDAWFVGYTDTLLVAVWVGYDQPARLRAGRREESGGTLAVPIAEAIFVQEVRP